jgi:hypothetical protein
MPVKAPLRAMFLLRERLVKLARAPATVEEQARQALRELLSGRVGRGEDADAARDAWLAVASSPGQDPHGPGADVQRRAPGLDQLLRALLQVLLYPVFRHLNEILVRWAMRKYKRLRRHKGRARRFIADVARRQPNLFAHWRLGMRPDGWTMGAR